MTILFEGALPQLPGRAQDQAGGRVRQSQDRWQLAMEQAQLADWFRALGTGAGAVAAQPNAQPDPQRAAEAGFDATAAVGAATPVAPRSAHEAAVRHALEAAPSRTHTAAAEAVETIEPDAAVATPSAARSEQRTEPAVRAGGEGEPAGSSPRPADGGASGARAGADAVRGSAALPDAPRTGAQPASPALASSDPFRVQPALQLFASAPQGIALDPRAVPDAPWPVTTPALISDEPSPVAARPIQATQRAGTVPGTATPPVRVHVTWRPEGAEVWLGVDHDRLDTVPALVQQIEQRLQAAGHRLLAIVCNGRTVYPRPFQGGSQ